MFNWVSLNIFHVNIMRIIIIFRTIVQYHFKPISQLTSKFQYWGSNQPWLILGSSHLIFTFSTDLILQSSHVENLEKFSVLISSLYKKLCLHFLHTSKHNLQSSQKPSWGPNISIFNFCKSPYWYFRISSNRYKIFGLLTSPSWYLRHSTNRYAWFSCFPRILDRNKNERCWV